MTKAEKKKAQAYKEEVARSKQQLDHLTPQQLFNLESYVTYQILYINDAACNCCKFLGGTLKTIPYKSNQAQKIYGALMKRINAYWELIQLAVPAQTSLSELFSNMDGYMDGCIEKMQKEIESVLVGREIQNPKWIAQLETARTVTAYAVEISNELIHRLLKFTPRALDLKKLILAEPLRVIDNLCKFVQEANHMRNVNINLNEMPRVVGAFSRLTKQFLKAENYTTALNEANEENRKNGDTIL